MNSSYSDFKHTQNYSQIDNESKNSSVSECKRVGPIYLIGYLGSAILTKGKTGLGCLQQPLNDLYMSFRCNSSKLFQERRLIISVDGLSLLYNEAGIEKIISNDLSSVNDIQLLRLDCERRKDKKTYSAFVPFGEEIIDNRYQNLYCSLDKNQSQTIESLAHPPVIALVMRRSTGIQALECHVFIARSTAEAKSIVMSIRNVCSKYKYDQSQTTQVFQYTPFADEQNLDLITNLNTTSNSQTLTKTKRHHASSIDSKENKANSSSVFSKSETSLNSKNNSTTLFNKLRANMRESSATRSRSKSRSNNNAGDKGVPPLPSKKPQVKSKQKDESKRRFNKFLNKSFSTSSNQQQQQQQKETSIQENVHQNQYKQQQQQTFEQSKINNATNLVQPSTTSISSTSNQEVKISKDKKPSIGKRLFSSINSKSAKNLSSKSTTSINTVKSTTTKQEKNIKNSGDLHLGDIDFRKSRTSIIDDNLLIDGSTIYPAMITQPTNDCNQNFILKSRNSPLVDECSRPTYAKSTNYLSSPSLVQNQKDQYRTSSYHSNHQQQQPIRAQSVASIYRPESPRISSYGKDMAYIGSKKSFSGEYEKNSSQGRLSRRPPDYFSEIEINGGSRIRSPIEEQKLLSNHLVWNKNSKSAESLDKKLASSSSNYFSNSRNTSRNASRNASRLDSESVIARAISPGIHLMNKIEPTRSRSSYVTSDFRHNLIKENKIANINQIINSNINNHQVNSLSYTPISSVQKIPNSKYTSYVSIGGDKKPISNENGNTVFSKSEYNLDSHLNDYSRINKAYNQASSSDFYSIGNAKSEYDFDSASRVTGRFDINSFDQRSEVYENEKKSNNKHNKIVGGIKVLPHFTYHDNNNEYNFIDSSDKVFKQQQQEASRQDFLQSDFNMSKLTHQYTTSMSIDNEHVDHEVIDLTKRNKIPTNNSNQIEIPIYLSTTSNESPNEYPTHMHKQTSTKFVNIEPYDKPRMVSTAFITPIIPDEHKFSSNNRNSPVYQMSVQKPRCIYYYDDDESFGGY